MAHPLNKTVYDWAAGVDFGESDLFRPPQHESKKTTRDWAASLDFRPKQVETMTFSSHGDWADYVEFGHARYFAAERFDEECEDYSDSD